MANRKRKIQVVPIDQLKQDPINARAHSEANIEAIGTSIETVGPARPVLLDEDCVILAGNGTQIAAIRKGLKKVKIIDVDGMTLVAVRVKGLSMAQKRYLSVTDNRTADMATWKPEIIQKLIDDGFGQVVNAVWYPVELDALLGIEEGSQSEAVLPKRLRNQASKNSPLFRFGAYELEMNEEEGRLLKQRLDGYVKAGGSLQGLFSQVIVKVNDKIDALPEIQS